MFHSRRKLIFTAVLTFILSSIVGTESHSAQTTVFYPKGPYDASILNLNTGMTSIADFTAILMPDGTIRGYSPYDTGLRLWESKDDGFTFKEIGKTVGGGGHQSRVILLPDGKYHVFSSGGDGISCWSSPDGLNFTIDKQACVPISWIESRTLKYGDLRISGPAVAILPNGSYRMYFSDEGAPGDGAFPPHQVFSAISTDAINWTLEPGVRIGWMSSGLKSVANHPTLIQHNDGSITLFYRDFVNLNYATSTDGLNFGNEHIVWFDKADPIAGQGNGGDPNVVADAKGNLVLYIGQMISKTDFGTIAVRLKPGKGSVFGQEVGRAVSSDKTLKREYLNCAAKDQVSDPLMKNIQLQAGPSNSCPDGYIKDSSNPMVTKNIATYSDITRCFMKPGLTPQIENLSNGYFSGANTCPNGYEVQNQPQNSSGNQGSGAGQIDRIKDGRFPAPRCVLKIGLAGNDWVGAGKNQGTYWCPKDYLIQLKVGGTLYAQPPTCVPLKGKPKSVVFATPKNGVFVCAKGLKLKL